MTKKILYITDKNTSCRLIANYIAPLKMHGWEIDIHTFPDPTIERPCCILKASEIQQTFKKNGSFFLSLQKRIKQFRPDIVHTYGFRGSLLGTIASKLTNVKTIIYQMNGFFSDTHLASTCKTACKIAEKLVYNTATQVIAESPSLRNEAIARRYCNDEKVDIIFNGSNGIDAALFSRKKWEIEGIEIRKSFKIPQDAFIISCIATKEEQKGLSDLLSAWKRIQKNYPNTYLLLVRLDDTEKTLSRELLTHQLENDSRILLPTDTDPIHPYYAASDLFVLPIHHDTFSDALIEAQSMELPVVSTLTLGTIDAVVDHSSAILVDPYDDYHLEEAIETYIESPELRLKHADFGRRHVLEHFQLADFTDKLADYYNALYLANK